VVVDRLSKAAHFMPVRTLGNKVFTARDAAKLFVQSIVRCHGMPTTIITDRDTRWAGNFWQAMCERLGTRLALSTAYHPETDGQTERTNRTLEEMLRNYVNDAQNDWEEWLPLVEFAYNDSESASTGFTPFYLLYGEHPRSPLTACLPREEQVPAADAFVRRMQDNLQLAKQHIQRAQNRQK
jgi:transposase InsO family protein